MTGLLSIAALRAPALVSLGVALWIASASPLVSGGEEVTRVLQWFPAFDIAAAFRLDGLSFAFALLVTGVGAVVLLYSSEYFRDDPRRWRVVGLLSAFETAMLGLVLADDAITFFVFWELTTVISYLLVGFDHQKSEAREKALQALLVTGMGGLALMAGLILLGDAAGTMRFSEMALIGDDLRADPMYLVFLALILTGCFTKSAQFPFHFWLPNAMAAPTPVSAYLHSATMVKAGVYLIMRLSPELGGTEVWSWTLTLVGGLTMLIGAVWALGQRDLKLMLAHTTVSGLGALVMFLGSRETVAIAAASTFLVVHAFYKAALFLTIGILDKKAGSRALPDIGGLGRIMPITWLIAVLASFSMAGFPPLLGFIGKELKYEGALAVASEPLLVAGIAVVSNALMGAVGLILALKPFLGERRALKDKPTDPHPALWAGPAALALCGLAFGLAPGVLSTTLIEPMANAVAGEVISVPLKLWHGVNIPLLLSVTTFAIAIGAYLALPVIVAQLRAAQTVAPRAEGGFERVLGGMKALAASVSARMQQGALSRYLAVIFGVFAAMLLGAALIGGEPDFPEIPVAPALNWGSLALVAAGTVMLLVARSRIGALGGLGMVGAGAAAVFALYGAIDVAMTQLLVETLMVVIVAVALPRLPMLRPAPGGMQGRVAAMISVAAGLGAAMALLAALASPGSDALSDFYAAAAWPEAFGRNVVNVVLVDFRALDTFGEILVVALAAVAAVAVLGRGGRRI